MDRVLAVPEIEALARGHRRDAVVRVIRDALEQSRREISAGAPVPSLFDITGRVSDHVQVQWHAGYRRVVNATGVILHTNLGRAPLSGPAIDAMIAAAGYSDLEMDLMDGERANRQRRLTAMLRDLTGAEAALVVTNNAAAVTLALAGIARGKRVIVSRGQAVEIGGGFRVPAIVRQSGARLVEVGTTNRTRLEDYEEALDSGVAAILHVHSSNFKIVGFTATVSLRELASLARDRGVMLVSDNGSGPLVDTRAFGLAHEVMPSEALEAGADVVCFSGDKLLGGPQAGIILGSDSMVSKLARHPLARAMRPDKLCLAALSATLRSYLMGRVDEVPIIRMLGESVESLQTRAGAFASAAAARGLSAVVEPGESTVGGGSLPGETLPTALVTLPPGVSAAALRTNSPPVLARTRAGKCQLDLRTVPAEDEPLLLDAAVRAASSM